MAAEWFNQNSFLSTKPYLPRLHMEVWKKFKMCVSCKSTVGADTLSPPITEDIKFYPVGEVENTKQDSSLEITLLNGICCKVYLPVASINKFLQELLK